MRTRIPKTQKNMVFSSISEAVKAVRRELKLFRNVTFGVRRTPANAIEKHIADYKTIFIDWTGGPSYPEIRDFVKQLDVQLHAGRGSVNFHFARKEE